jgi:hypothetical protein
MRGVTRKYSNGFTKVGDDLRLPSKDEGWILYLGDVSIGTFTFGKKKR